MSMRIGVVAAIATVVLGALAPAASGKARYTAASGCVEHQGFFAGDEAAVDARLPDAYEPVRDNESGKPLVFARALSCEKATIDGHTAPTMLASYGITIQ